MKRQIPMNTDAWLTDDAINYLVLRSLEKNESAYSFATRHFWDDAIVDVIRRVHEATSQKMFPLGLDLAKNPKEELRKWLELVG